MKAQSLQHLKACISQAAKSLDMELIRNTIAQVPQRRDLLVKNEGRDFEYQMPKKQCVEMRKSER